MLASQTSDSVPSSWTAIYSLHTPAPTKIYTLSLHDALPILLARRVVGFSRTFFRGGSRAMGDSQPAFCPCSIRTKDSIMSIDRKSTRLNSSHVEISYAVFCLKKKKFDTHRRRTHHDVGTDDS